MNLLEIPISRRLALKAAAVLIPSLALRSSSYPPANQVEPGTVNPTAIRLPIVFETEYNPDVEKEIAGYLVRLPERMAQQAVREGYKVVMVKNQEAVEKRKGGGQAGAYMDPYKKEIVLDNTLNFPHELGHAIDSAFGDLSLSEDFLPAELIYARQDIVRLTETRNHFAAQLDTADDEIIRVSLESIISNYNRDIDAALRFQDIAGLHPRLRGVAFLLDSDVRLYVGHIFVPGFLAYYYNKPGLGSDWENTYPDLYSAFDRLDMTQRQSQ